MNLILATDSYKISHWGMYEKDTETVFSYFESRRGAAFPSTVFFGLQHILRPLVGAVVNDADIDEAGEFAEVHFGADLFNWGGWEHIVKKHDGRLPLRIRAVPEGTAIPTDNVLMTVENTDPACWWLTNALESYLLHVWYPSTVATVSRHVKERIAQALTRSGANLDALPFMLHDFGYRGATTHDAAAIGGLAHLVNFVGSDTLPAMEVARDSYDADLNTLMFSVPATEHSIMTSLGPDRELELVARLIDEHPTGVLSVVADSYSIERFVEAIGRPPLREKILARDGVFVVRPDSPTPAHPSPAEQMVWLAQSLYHSFGGELNGRSFRVVDPHVRLLWGDGLDVNKIDAVLGRMVAGGYSAENIATLGMGGGLLQKVNRDTQSFAFKSSAQQRKGEWFDVSKKPLDGSKESKAGRLMLWRRPDRSFYTAVESAALEDEPMLRTVFENGRIVRPTTFAEVRERAELPQLITC